MMLSNRFMSKIVTFMDFLKAVGFINATAHTGSGN